MIILKQLTFSFFLLPTFLFSEMSPDTALERLMKGNERYVLDQLTSPARTSLRRQALVSKQTPFAVILGCSDSRVPPEIVFDQGVGDLFVVRVAGNVVGGIELDSIEYAVEYLGSSVVLVLGHENCGAVKAVLAGKTADIEEIASLIEPAIAECKKVKEDDLEHVVKCNVKHTADFLQTSPVLAKMIKAGTLKVVGGYYDLKTGKVNLL